MNPQKLCRLVAGSLHSKKEDSCLHSGEVNVQQVQHGANRMKEMILEHPADFSIRQKTKAAGTPKASLKSKFEYMEFIKHRSWALGIRARRLEGFCIISTLHLIHFYNRNY